MCWDLGDKALIFLPIPTSLDTETAPSKDADLGNPVSNHHGKGPQVKLGHGLQMFWPEVPADHEELKMCLYQIKEH